MTAICRILLPSWEKVGREAARMRGLVQHFPIVKQRIRVQQPPHPSGFACHLLPRGEKESWLADGRSLAPMSGDFE